MELSKIDQVDKSKHKKNVLHLVFSGVLGGIQTLVRDICLFSNNNNFVFFENEKGIISDEIVRNGTIVFFNLKPKWNFLSKEKDIFKIIKNRKIDVVICHDTFFPSILACLHIKKKMPKVKIIFYEHNDIYETFSKRRGIFPFFNKILVKRLIKEANYVIAISKFVKESGERLQPCKKSIVIYNGINLSYFRIPVVSYIKSSTSFELLYVGRILYEKGIQVLIDAVDIIRLHIPNLHLSIVGSGEGGYYENIKKECLSTNLIKNITLFKPTSDPRVYYQNCDFFIHPAIWNEGFGLTLVEAMACGKPCICFNKGAISEIVNKNNGILVNEVTSEALSKAILYAYNIFLDKRCYNKMSEFAKTNAKRFSISKTIQELEKNYQ